MKHRIIHWSVCAAACAILSGCVVVPYTPKADVTPAVASLEDAAHTFVTIGPRRFLEDVGKEIVRLDPKIKLVDNLALRDALFPNGGWSLEELLQEASRPNLAASGADYLAIIGPPKVGKTDSSGMFLWYLISLGAEKSTMHSSLSAMLVDLKQGQTTGGVNIRVDGEGAAVGYVYAVIVTPMMDASLLQGTASGIVQAVRRMRPGGNVRIGLLAREDKGKEAQEAAKAVEHETALKYMWLVVPTPKDWEAALARLDPAEQALIKGTPLTFGVSGPEVEDTLYYDGPVPNGTPDKNIVSGVDLLDLAALCDGFNHSFGPGTGGKWEIVKALSYEGWDAKGSLQTHRFRLNWTFRGPKGRLVPATATGSSPGTEVGSFALVFHSSKTRAAIQTDRNQALALAFLKLVVHALKDQP